MKNTNAGPQKPNKAEPAAGKSFSFWLLRALLFFLAAVVTMMMIFFNPGKGLGKAEFVVGEPAPQSLFSPMEVTFVDQKATEALRREKAQAVAPVFSVDARSLPETKEKIARFLEQIKGTKISAAAGEKSEGVEKTLALPQDNLQWLVEKADIREVERELGSLIDKIAENGIFSDTQKAELVHSGFQEVMIVGEDKKDRKKLMVQEAPSLGELRKKAEVRLPESVSKDRNFKETILNIITAAATTTLVEEEGQTRSRRKEAEDAAAPVQDRIKKGELIIQRGVLVGSEEKKKIDQIEKKLAEHKILNQLGSAGLLILLTYLLGFFYLAYFEKKMMASLRMLLLILIVLVTTVFVSKAILILPNSSAYWMPTALAPLLLILLTHARLGVLSAVMMAVLTAPLSGFGAEVIVGTLLSGFAATLAALRLRKRIQSLKVGAAIGFTYFSVLFSFRLFQEAPLAESIQVAFQGLANGLLITTSLGFFLLLPFFEYIFGLATDITLLELSDLNHPLLKRMIVEAPGTYHHSLVVSTLAESACEAMGANPLLARVGCYFHDIGKIAQSEFFTENQGGKEIDRHEKLSATMSCLLIMNHVKEGMELGRRNKLKDAILRFIPEHHGTGVIYYFYKKALDEARAGEKVNADDFRYPGPKPQSRETAAALLADSTEAASRCIKDPTPEGIRMLVRKIINDKFIDGQLDECDLTLRDLYRIQESFVHNLMAIFHTRVSYPAAPELPDKPDLFEEGEFSKYRAHPPY